MTLLEPTSSYAPAAPRRSGPKRFWTTREVKLLETNYPSGGLPACAPLLPHRDEGSIYQKANILGLHAPGYVQGFSYQRYATNDQIDAVIRRAYEAPPKRNTVANLARTLGRPRWWISKRAAMLGLAMARTKEPVWSEQEIEIIAANAHRKVDGISRALKRAGFNRTTTAVSVKLKRIGQPTGRNGDLDHYTAGGLASVMGIDSKTVTRWIANGLLKAERRGTSRTQQQGGDEYAIHRKEVRRFIIRNTAAVDLRKVEKFWFVEILAGEAAS